MGGLGVIIESNLNRVRLSCCWVGVGLGCDNIYISHIFYSCGLILRMEEMPTVDKKNSNRTATHPKLLWKQLMGLIFIDVNVSFWLSSFSEVGFRSIVGQAWK